MIAESSAGKAKVKSASRITTSSIQPRLTAASRPRATPKTMPMPTAIRPTAIETRLPTISSETMSRPRLSVPSQCDALGPCSLCGMSSSVAGCGVQTYESSARPITIVTSTAPTRRLACRHAGGRGAIGFATSAPVLMSFACARAVAGR
jgi:hypothetical protein